jgi:hypothetical protein
MHLHITDDYEKYIPQKMKSITKYYKNYNKTKQWMIEVSYIVQLL